MVSALSTAYEARLSRGEITADPTRAAAIAALARLEKDLAGSEPNGPIPRLRKTEAQRGVYLSGQGGRAHSRVIDLFIETAQTARKRHTHFHSSTTDGHPP